MNCLTENSTTQNQTNSTNWFDFVGLKARVRYAHTQILSISTKWMILG